MAQEKLALKEIAGRIDGAVVGDGEVMIGGVAGIKEAGEGDLTFLANSRYDIYLSSTNASAVIVGSKDLKTSKPLIVVADPYLAFLKVLKIFRPDKIIAPTGVHPTAVIGDRVQIGQDVSIGPNVVIQDDVTIGDGAVIMAGCFIGQSSRVGAGTLIYPNVTIREECSLGNRVIVHPGAVIGSDGFGFARDGKVYRKVPQTGIVVVGDDVEIGANVTVDRATIGATVIGNGTKIDNLVQIAHNVVTGENCIIVAQVGISGSTEIGNNVTLGGQAGVVGHIKIGDNTFVGAQAGVIKSIPADTQVSGYPALPHSVSKRLHAAIKRLPELLKTVRMLEKKLEDIEMEKTK